MRFVAWTFLLFLPLIGGCETSRLTARRVDSTDIPIAGRDAENIVQCADRMDQCIGSIQRLQKTTRRNSEFLLPREHDLIERSLAEYLFYRDELEQIAERQSKSDIDLSSASVQCKTQHDAHLAFLSVDDPVLWQALNQSFRRSGISRGSCDRILHEVTASRAAQLDGDARGRIKDVIRHRGLLLPAAENELRHTRSVELISDLGRAFSSQLQHGQNILITKMVRITSPMARPLMISEEQRKQIRNALQPGDVVLTYTVGYGGNLVIPGNFKHAATFVGTENERRQAGLSQETLLAINGPDNQRLARVLTQTTIDSGECADVVEAVAEGIRLNNLDRMLTLRINRLIAIRPRLNQRERAEQIRDVLSYVGDEFDFSFDLTDTSEQVCTEVIYRSLQGRGGIDLVLSTHAGRRTLLPDDILKYQLQTDGNQFECILVVDKAPEAAEPARILPAAEAHEWIAQLMGTHQ
jgi:hypothetical protein